MHLPSAAVDFYLLIRMNEHRKDNYLHAKRERKNLICASLRSLGFADKEINTYFHTVVINGTAAESLQIGVLQSMTFCFN